MHLISTVKPVFGDHKAHAPLGSCSSPLWSGLCLVQNNIFLYNKCLIVNVNAYKTIHLSTQQWVKMLFNTYSMTSPHLAYISGNKQREEEEVVSPSNSWVLLPLSLPHAS